MQQLVMAALAAAMIVAPAAAQQGRPTEMSPFMQDRNAPTLRPLVERAGAYVRDAWALHQMRTCPQARPEEAKANLNRLLAQRRAQFMESVTDPYVRGYVDGLLAARTVQLAHEVADETLGGRRPLAVDRACAEATEHVARMLLR